MEEAGLQVRAQWTYEARAMLGRERTPQRRSLATDVMLQVAQVGSDEARVSLDCSQVVQGRESRFLYRTFRDRLYVAATLPDGAGQGHEAWLQYALSTLPVAGDQSGRSVARVTVHEGTQGLVLEDSESAARVRTQAVAEAHDTYILVDGTAWVRAPEPRLNVALRAGGFDCEVVTRYHFAHEVGFNRLDDVHLVARLLWGVEGPRGAGPYGRPAMPIIRTLDPAAFHFPSESRSLQMSSSAFMHEMGREALNESREYVAAYLDLRDARRAVARHVGRRAGEERATGAALVDALGRAETQFAPPRLVKAALGLSKARWRSATDRWDAEAQALEADEMDDAAIAVAFG